MTKPFGKPVHHGRGLTRGLRFAIALWIAGFPAWLICRPAARNCAVLAEDAFFWPAVVGFSLFYSVSFAIWLRRRPSPRAPGTSSRRGLFLSRFFLSLLLGIPLSFFSAMLYEPALELANGMSSVGSPTIEFAMVQPQQDGRWVLDNPYWKDDFQWKVPQGSATPSDLVPGSIAKMTLRKGLLGARFIQFVEYTVLP